MAFWDTLRVSREGPKYLAICDALADAIAEGRLVAGRRLPSHRMLARKLGVSLGTATRAYETAIDRGLLSGRVGSGTFVRHRRTPPLSVVGGSRFRPGCLDLYQNIPAAVPKVEGRAWAEAIRSLASETDLAGIHRRSFSEVLPRHQRAGAAWLGRLGLDVAPDAIVDCPGTHAAFSAILAATTKPGDLLLAPCLSHPGVKLLAKSFGLRLRPLAMDRHGIDPGSLDAACRRSSPRLLYCEPTIHSPTTASMPEARRRAIAEVARRHDLLIIEEEIAGFLLPDPIVPIASLAPDHCFLVGETWLALSYGLRTTYILVPPGLAGQMARAVASVCGVTPPLMAEIAAHWIQSGAAGRLIARRRAELKARNVLTRRVLGRRRLAAHPIGNFVWLELPEGWRNDWFLARAEEAGIAVMVADWFSIGHGPVPPAARICIGNAPGRAALRKALVRIDDLLRDGPGATSGASASGR